MQETLPSWHWAYASIDALQMRGILRDLSRLHKPYTRGEIAQTLLHVEKMAEDKKILLTRMEAGHIQKLFEEFRIEILELEESDVKPCFRLGGRSHNDIFKSGDDKAEYKGIHRTRIAVPVGKKLTLFNTVNFDQYNVDDSLYIGKKWRGIVAYTEQAYIRAGWKHFRFQFGRDFIQMGAGQSGTLLFSNVTRPMDHLMMNVFLGPFRYSYTAAVLDEVNLSAEWAAQQGGYKARRYLSSHRLDMHFFKGALQCAFSESILYGGVNQNLSWAYLNPFIFYHGAQMNSEGMGNTVGTLDILMYPVKSWEIYSSLLIDDLQIEKTGSGDLEPAEIGWLAGTRLADPFNISGAEVSTEFVRITNRTYKTPFPWETFIHRNDPLGHPLGHDFDYWTVGISQWINASFQMNLFYSRTRKGEGSLYTPWDAPWMDVDVEEGYSEPYLSGTVETLSQYHVGFKYRPFRQMGLEADFWYNDISNQNHIKGEMYTGMDWRIRLWFDGDWTIHL